MRKLWLIFAQTATVCLAVLFVVSTLRPDLLNGGARGSVPSAGANATSVVTVKEPPAELLARSSASFSDAARKAMPAVVNIFTSQEIKRPRQPFMDDPVFRFFFGDQSSPTPERRVGLGSGVIASDQGYIITNNHVIESVDQIEVALSDSRKVPAKIVGTDPDTDIAVLKIDVSKLPSITFARSEQVRVGDVVLAIGNPFGVGQTITMGIVSGLGRNQLGITTFENFIQTDAAINPGNSGGALVDASGNLVGINTAIFSRSPEGASVGIGYAIPAGTARQVMDEIIQKGSVTRGWIGVGVQDVTREIAESFKLRGPGGVLVTQVERGGPADRAGIRLGDVLVKVNDRAVSDTRGMQIMIAALKPGDQVKLKVTRNHSESELSATVGRRPRPPVQKS